MNESSSPLPPLMIVVGGAGAAGSAILKLAREAGYRTRGLDRQPCPLADEYRLIDLSQESQIEAALSDIEAVQALVFAPGAIALSSIEDTSWDQWLAVMQVTVRGAMLCLKHTAPKLLSQTGSVVLLTDAPQGSDGSHHNGQLEGGDDLACRTAQGALLGLMRATSGEFAARGIRVNAVRLGPVQGALSALTPAAAPQAKAQVQALALAEAALFLASADATFITGTEVSVDAGNGNDIGLHQPD